MVMFLLLLALFALLVIVCLAGLTRLFLLEEIVGMFDNE